MKKKHLIVVLRQNHDDGQRISDGFAILQMQCTLISDIL
jgi:hypothetical protein